MKEYKPPFTRLLRDEVKRHVETHAVPTISSYAEVGILTFYYYSHFLKGLAQSVQMLWRPGASWTQLVMDTSFNTLTPILALSYVTLLCSFKTTLSC